ncbi:hypothetical protein ACA910_022091 [Epithemia clementina (nom. ined.)]
MPPTESSNMSLLMETSNSGFFEQTGYGKMSVNDIFRTNPLDKKTINPSMIRRHSVEPQLTEESTGSYGASEVEVVMKLPFRTRQQHELERMPQVIPLNSTDSEDEDEADDSNSVSLRPIPFRVYPSKSLMKKSLSYPLPKMPKKVRYDSITVHYHSVSLGDSPSVSKGPPIAMTWERLDTEVFPSLEKYEEERPELRGKRKIRLRATRREKILLRAGVTSDQMQACMAMVERLKREQEENETDESPPSILSLESTSSHSYPQGTGFCGNSDRQRAPLTSPLENFWFDWICSSSAHHGQ